ncbi:MAG: flavin reductase (DIM6/NTAB) family NADH-FMN oxidoreductase RutF [Saprospiraceae bacterium]|jgi:flavin reductase (DIM6/NTAB) family NADH-FMN oxidoreductase RutF
MHLNKEDLQNTERIKRLNILNSVSGIKPANLIGTVSNDQQSNLAIFSSVIHLGSNPPLLGFISRPDTEERRHTLENIMETNFYTINHVHESFVQNAHYTSAKFEKEQSEFSHCGLTEEYLLDFKAPFVAESRLKIGMQFLESLPIKANGTIMIIGEIQHLLFPDDALSEEGYIDFGILESAGLTGLNHYYRMEKIASYPFARVRELPDFSK